MPEGFDRVIARALAKDPADRYPSAGDLGRAALARGGGAPGHGVRADGRARRRRAGAATRGARNGHTAVTVVPRRRRSARRARRAPATQPGVTLPLGDRPRRRRRGRAGRALLVVAARRRRSRRPPWRSAAASVDARRLPGAPVADGEVEQLAQDFAAAYGEEDSDAARRSC